MKRYAVLIAAFMFLIANTTFSQNIKTKVRTKPPKTSDWFYKQNIFQCNGHNVVVNTSCVEKEDDLPYCFNQTVDFIRAGGDVDSSINFLYSFKDGNQEFIANASCAPHKGEAYVVLENTNFGNCKICEWIDVFSEGGKYIGSTKGMYDLRNFPHKPLPRGLESAILRILSDKNVQSAHIEISRSR